MHQEQTAFEKIVGKGEISRNDNFSFSHNVFYSIRYLYFHLSTLYVIELKLVYLEKG